MFATKVVVEIFELFSSINNLSDWFVLRIIILLHHSPPLKMTSLDELKVNWPSRNQSFTSL